MTPNNTKDLLMAPDNGPRVFPAVAELAAQAVNAATEAGDPIGHLVGIIQGAMRAEANPYVLIGLLVEGIALTLNSIPESRRTDAISAAIAMLLDRIRNNPPARNG